MLHYNDLVKVKEWFYKGDVAIVQNAMKQSDTETDALKDLVEWAPIREVKYTYLLKFLAGNQEQFQEDELELLDKEEWMKDKKAEDKRRLNGIRAFFARF